MKVHKKYKLIIEDESCLVRIAQLSFRPRQLLLIGVVVLIFTIIVGFLFVLLTPAKRLIPGYYQPSQRAASEEAMMRLDSVVNAYERNNSYLNNIISLIDDKRIPEDSVSQNDYPLSLTPITLMPTSQEETKFNRIMQEREKYNISVLAPLAAEGMIFYPVNADGIITGTSIDMEVSRMIVPSESPIMSISDGKVVGVLRSPGVSGNTLIIQHNNGFVSKYSGLGALMSGDGENVNGGQVIALSQKSSGKSSSDITIELWHNGTTLKPYKYLTGNITL